MGPQWHKGAPSSQKCPRGALGLPSSDRNGQAVRQNHQKKKNMIVRRCRTTKSCAISSSALLHGTSPRTSKLTSGSISNQNLPVELSNPEQIQSLEKEKLSSCTRLRRLGVLIAWPKTWRFCSGCGIDTDGMIGVVVCNAAL